MTCCAISHVLTALGVPVLAGLSRKVDAREDHGTRPVASAFTPASPPRCSRSQRGAHIVRVHDVTETRDALAVWSARRGSIRRSTKAEQDEPMTRKYFGTDGVRGKVGEAPITPEFVHAARLRGWQGACRAP